ncbi:MAG: PLP-dependent aminotransferase family protein [Alphaproteobacteria bacterium]|nr:MAG: PLP-dependent aminotransferase family protein [Alphaproteobacteria bacterium]
MRKFEEIADHILQQVADGDLKPGDRLPTHRDTAYLWNCSLGTASRAYAELERRGVAFGKVGQGTFIYGTLKDEAEVGKGVFFPSESWPEGWGGIVDLSKNSYFHPLTEERLRDVLMRVARYNNVPSYMSYFDSRGRDIDRRAAANWLSLRLQNVKPDNIVITQGAQSGLYLAMATLCSPGDVVATECFGYPGIRAAAFELDLKLAPVEMDAEGLIPEEFERLCRKGTVKLLVTVPTNHNPTGATQPRVRREVIAEIARRHNVFILEDAAYDPLHIRREPAYCDIAPEISLYVTTLSKVFSLGLRVGYLHAPAKLIPRLATKMTAINWMTSPVILDMTNFLLQSGQVEAQGKELIDICSRREGKAREILGPWLDMPEEMPIAPLAHFWLRLPQGVEMAEFVGLARRENIIVIAGDTFAVNRTVPVHHIRLCLMAEPDEERLIRALRRLETLLQTENSPLMLS